MLAIDASANNMLATVANRRKAKSERSAREKRNIADGTKKRG
jgi:hypothetical protein